MQAWCERGPAFARVDAVDCHWHDADAGYGDFEIR
jgi:hypothetical protein